MRIFAKLESASTTFDQQHLDLEPPARCAEIQARGAAQQTPGCGGSLQASSSKGYVDSTVKIYLCFHNSEASTLSLLEMRMRQSLFD
jgi:hypothetical protein